MVHHAVPEQVAEMIAAVATTRGYPAGRSWRARGPRAEDRVAVAAE